MVIYVLPKVMVYSSHLLIGETVHTWGSRNHDVYVYSVAANNVLVSHQGNIIRCSAATYQMPCRTTRSLEQSK